MATSYRSGPNTAAEIPSSTVSATYADFASDLMFQLHLLRHQARASYTLIDRGPALDDQSRESVSFMLAGMEEAARELAARVSASEFAFTERGAA